MDLQTAIVIAVIGMAAGVLGGMLGLGGAIIIIPALVMLLGFSQQTAQGTALLMMVFPVGGLAAFQYYQSGYIDIKAALVMSIFFFVGGYLGAKFATQVPQIALKKGFALLLVVIAVKMWFFDKPAV